MMKTITLSDGSEWACNSEGEGVFTRRLDGTWAQVLGTGQAGPFATPQKFSRYVHRSFRTAMAESLPRMVRHSGWT